MEVGEDVFLAPGWIYERVLVLTVRRGSPLFPCPFGARVGTLAFIDILQLAFAAHICERPQPCVLKARATSALGKMTGRGTQWRARQGKKTRTGKVKREKKIKIKGSSFAVTSCWPWSCGNRVLWDELDSASCRGLTPREELSLSIEVVGYRVSTWFGGKRCPAAKFFSFLSSIDLRPPYVTTEKPPHLTANATMRVCMRCASVNAKVQPRRISWSSCKASLLSCGRRRQLSLPSQRRCQTTRCNHFVDCGELSREKSDLTCG